MLRNPYCILIQPMMKFFHLRKIHLGFPCVAWALGGLFGHSLVIFLVIFPRQSSFVNFHMTDMLVMPPDVYGHRT